MIRSVTVSVSVLEPEGRAARRQRGRFGARSLAIIRVQQPTRSLADKVCFAPAEPRGPCRVDADEPAPEVCHREQVLAHGPDTFTLLRLIGDPLCQRLSTLAHFLFSAFLLSNFLRYDVDTENAPIRSFQRVPVGQPDPVGVDHV